MAQHIKRLSLIDESTGSLSSCRLAGKLEERVEKNACLPTSLRAICDMFRRKLTVLTVFAGRSTS